jgi:hypothetical protein
MQWREFITFVGSAAAAWPLAARAQQAARTRRVGILLNASSDDPQYQAWVGTFLQELALLGWVIGRNVRIDTRWAGTNVTEIRRHAAELAALAPDVILALGANPDQRIYLEAFNGNGRFTYDRIGRGTAHIENCTVSIIGGVQPSRIAPIVRGAISGASNDGLIQRLQMTVWPNDCGSWQWVDRKPDVAARIAYEKVFRELYDLHMGDTDKPAVLRFAPESQALFQEWMTEIQIEARSGSLPSTLESHILKMPKTVASLALLFELADGGRFEVNEAAMLRALGWADYLRSHASRLYSAGETMAADGARLIVERRHQLPESFTPRDIQRKGWASLGDRDAVISAIELLVTTHHCREVPPVFHHAGGRPSISYNWNPSLKSEGC